MIYKCNGFTGDITIPLGLTTIESGTFKGCSGLNGKLTVPSDVSIIKNEAFLGTRFGEVVLNEGLKEIGSRAFGSVYGYDDCND